MTLKVPALGRMVRVKFDLKHAAATIGLLSVIGVSGYFVVRPLWAEHHFSEAERALQAHDLEQARTHLLRCLDARPDKPEVYFLLARTARRSGDYDQANSYLKECARHGGIRTAIELEYDLQRIQRGIIKPDTEEFLWAAVKKGHPDAIPILEALAAGYMQTFRVSTAVECLEEWLTLRPDDTKALWWRGESLRQLMLSGQALEDFRRLVELDPKHARGRRHLAELYVSLKQYREALPHFQWLRQRTPEDTDVALGVARCQVALGQAEAAGAILEPLLRAAPDDVPVLVECAKVALDNRDPSRAEKSLRRAVALSPNNFDAVYNLVRCLGAAGNSADQAKWERRLKELEADWRRVSELLTKKLRHSPKDPGLRFEAGKLLLQLGNEKEGLNWLQSALREDPWHQETHRTLRDYYRAKGRLDLAAFHDRATQKRENTSRKRK